MKKLFLASAIIIAETLTLNAELLKSFLGVEFGSKVLSGKPNELGMIEVSPKKKFRNFNHYYVIPTFSSKRVFLSGAMVTFDMDEITVKDVAEEMAAIKAVIMRRYESYGIREHKNGDALYDNLLVTHKVLASGAALGKDDFAMFSFQGESGEVTHILYLLCQFNEREKVCTIVLKAEDVEMSRINEREKQDRIDKRKIVRETGCETTDLDAL